MHESVRAWVSSQIAAHDLAALSVLEIGSLDENGTIRDLFSGPYLGVDMREGPGVDRVVNAHELKLKAGSYQVVICAEMIEHDPAYWLSLAEIGRVLRRAGHLLLTTRGNGFGEHRYPADYWRFMPDSGIVIAELADCDLLDMTLDPQAPGIFIHGVRR